MPQPLLNPLRRARQLLAAFALGGTLALQPQPAQAQCGPDATMMLVGYAFETGQSILSALYSAFTSMQGLFSTFFSDQGKSLVLNVTKSIAASKELGQASLNYAALMKSHERAAEAYDNFASVQAQPYNACQTSETTQAAGSAAVEARQNAKALTSGDVARSLYVENPGAVQEKLWQAHGAKFCSQIDADRKRGCTPAPDYLRDADLSAASVTIPAGGETYTADELAAAYAFKAYVTDPVPEPMLPRAMQKTPAGERYLAEQKASVAQMSAAAAAINQVIARHTGDGGVSSAGGAPAGSSLSVVAMMKKYVDEHFGSNDSAAAGTFDYLKQLQTMDNIGLLRELALNLAAKNWFDYQLYLQQENIAAAEAVRLATVVRQDADRRLAAQRAGATAVNRGP